MLELFTHGSLSPVLRDDSNNGLILNYDFSSFKVSKEGDLFDTHDKPTGLTIPWELA